MQHFGDPTKYDINIEVDKNGGATGYYTVQGYPKSPLSAADQVIKDSADLDDLKRRVTPYSPEQVQKRIDKINGMEGSTSTSTVAVASTAGKKTVASAAAPKTAAPKAATPQVSMTDDDDLENAFPSYDSPATS